jgi:hypothetical protein
MFGGVTKLVNLTPHEINIWRGPDIPPSGSVARMQIEAKQCGTVMNIPVVHSQSRRITGLPTPKKGVIYLVSSTIAKEVQRPDVLAPDTTDGGVIRDGNGRIVAVTRLQLFCNESEIY